MSIEEKEEFENGFVTDYWRRKASELPPPKCDVCGGPESTLSFYLEWQRDPMAVMHYCDEHALAKRRQDRICMSIPLIIIILLVLYMIWQLFVLAVSET